MISDISGYLQHLGNKKKNLLVYINRLADAAEAFLSIFTIKEGVKFQLVFNEKNVCVCVCVCFSYISNWLAWIV